MKKLLIFFVVLNTHCLSAQDLNKATLSYFTDAFYQYDPALIAREKIMQIEKHEYRYAEDTVISHTVTERHLFDTLGMPTYIHTQYPGRDKSEIYYTYDSLNRLHTKEHYGISPELHYAKIEIIIVCG